MAQFPLFYRLVFTYMDPLVCCMTVYMCYFDPSKILEMAVPGAVVAAGDEFVYWHIGALYSMIALLSGGLLRYTSDSGVWKLVQAAVLIVDLQILAHAYVTQVQQGRFTLAGQRPEDWSSWILTGFVAVARTAFIAGVGFASSANSKRKAT